MQARRGALQLKSFYDRSRVQLRCFAVVKSRVVAGFFSCYRRLSVRLHTHPFSTRHFVALLPGRPVSGSIKL